MNVKCVLQILNFLCAVNAIKSLQYIQKDPRPGEISFGNFYESEEGAFLSKLGTLLVKCLTQNIEDCYFKCVENNDCLSVNVLTVENSKFQCQLLNWAGSNFKSFLVRRPNSWYMPMKTACDPNPCVNGGNCTSTDGGQNYTCFCVPLTSGRNCTKVHPCFLMPCKHGGKCTPTGGEEGYNCTCTVDFTGKHCECALFDFESGRLDGWTKEGTAFNNQPTYGDNPFHRGVEKSNLKGNWFIATFENRPSPTDTEGGIQGNRPTGSLTSPAFQIQGTKIGYLIGGPADTAKGRIELLIDGSVVMKTARPGYTGTTMVQHEFNVTSYRGETAKIRIVDASSDGWGIIMVDHIEDSCNA